ncbi:F0F1 ATP synthase subunit delta [Candidatus Saganbacteria bacterium]|nr:F0F1 ATP synthase subunit delta [Candidatus Saganbacteria bacterium]
MLCGYKFNQRRLYTAAQKDNAAGQLEDELYWFARLLRENYDLKLFMEDARYNAAHRKARLSQLFPPGLTKNFLALINGLIDCGKKISLEAAALNFARDLNRDTGLVIGEVFSAVALAEESRREVERVMSALKRAKVRLRYRLAPDILGGVCVKLVNGEVWNVSLDYKLQNLEKALLK